MMFLEASAETNQQFVSKALSNDWEATERLPEGSEVLAFIEIE
jgi:hypothetical protein